MAWSLSIRDIALGKAPTPGRMIPSDFRMTSASAETVVVAPTFSHAFSTDRRLPIP